MTIKRNFYIERVYWLDLSGNACLFASKEIYRFSSSLFYRENAWLFIDLSEKKRKREGESKQINTFLTETSYG